MLIRRDFGKPRSRGNGIRRFIDHLIGCPILLLLGALRLRRSAPQRPASAGILSCSAIGDTIIASAIARDIKAANPGCLVTVFISPSASGISKLVEGFDREVILPIRQPLAALRILRNHPTDILIDIMPWPRMSAIIAALSRSRYTLGFETDRQHRHFAFDFTTLHSGRRHELENYRELLRAFTTGANSLPCASRMLREAGRGMTADNLQIIIHPWASGFRHWLREWPAECWAELAQRLIAEGASIAISGGPSDQAQAKQLERLIDRPGRTTVLAGLQTLEESAVRIARATLMISVNTGTMHLAAALGCKLVALHGPTNPRRWGPLHEQAIVVGPDESQGGAFLNLGYEYPANDARCMRQITTCDVLQCARHALNPASVVWNNPAFALNVIEGPVRLRQLRKCAVARVPEENYTAERHDDAPCPVSNDVVYVKETVKRGQDLLIALILLILSLPAALVIALMIKLDSGGPVFYGQDRYGYRGKIIRIYKFRSMYHEMCDEHCCRQVTRDDIRVTPVGAFLRKTGLDELPQLLNVIKGDMSLVGPRPHAIQTNVNGRPLEEIVGSYNQRFTVKPGITGLAQVNGWRGPLATFEQVAKRVEYDLMYIERQSFWLETLILFRTIRLLWKHQVI